MRSSLRLSRRGVAGYTRGVRRLAPALLVSLAPLVACTERPVGPAPGPSTARDARPAAVPTGGPSVATAAPTAAPSAPPPTFADSVRLERWADAERELDALPEVEQKKAGIRYVRARVALHRSDHARAFKLLSGLEAELPLLADDIKRYRAEAAVVAGPVSEAVTYFEAQGKARDLIRATEALEKSGDKKAALKMAERALAAAQRGKQGSRDEIAARAARARLTASEVSAAAALPDRKWLAVHATGNERRAAQQALADAGQPLSRADVLKAAALLIDKGHPAEALELVEGLKRDKETLPLKALALFKARKWSDSLKALREALKVKTGREAELAYHEARALGRLGKDDDAQKVYADVAKRHKATPWGERAAYQVARTHLQRGKWDKAVAAYTKFLADHGKGEKRGEAEYDLALASLSAGKAALAKRTFEKLAQDKKNDEAAFMHELAGVAAQRAGEKEAAATAFSQVMRDAPLSFGAQAARARLAALGKPTPVWIEPAASAAAPTPLEVKLPSEVALLASLGLDVDAEAILLANEQAVAAPYVGHESEALCAMYEKLSRAKRRYKVASAAVPYASLQKAPTAQSRWQWECLYPRPYSATVRAHEEKHALPKNLGFGIMRQESAFDPLITSPVGAVGLMQLMPTTASAVAKEASIELAGKPLTSPDLNIALGTFYLGKLLKTFRGSLPLAVAGYNAGPGAVSQWLDAESDNEVDLWVARIPYHETRTYVQRVLGNVARYQYLEGGESAVVGLELEIPRAKAKDDDY